MTPSKRWRVAIVVAVVAAVSPGTGPLGLFGRASAAPGGASDKQQEAARIQSQIDAQAERIAAVDRQLRAAQERTQAAESALGRARAQLAEADSQAAEAKRRLAGEAVNAYVTGNSLSFLRHISESDGSDLPVRNEYMKAAVDTHRGALDELRAVREDLTTRRQALQEAQRSARSTAASLLGRRQQLGEVEAGQRANLARVRGELGRLLAAEQARRNAEVLSRSQVASRPRTSTAGQTGHTPPGGIWACIRQLESSNNYRAPGGGAYQIREPTWRSLGQSGQAEDADPALQDAMAIKLQQRSGWGQWPNTSRRCGAVD